MNYSKLFQEPQAMMLAGAYSKIMKLKKPQSNLATNPPL